MLIIADELLFETLPEETRKVCEKIIDSRVEHPVDEVHGAYPPAMPDDGDYLPRPMGTLPAT